MNLYFSKPELPDSKYHESDTSYIINFKILGRKMKTMKTMEII